MQFQIPNSTISLGEGIVTRSRSRGIKLSTGDEIQTKAVKSKRKFGDDLSNKLGVNGNSTIKDRKPISCISDKSDNIKQLSQQLNNENVDCREEISSKIDRSMPCFGETKKIKISEEERHMNGAPEGEIFEVVVLMDSQLASFQDLDDSLADEIFQAAQQKTVSESSSWADKYAFVEMIRSFSISKPLYLRQNELVEISAQAIFGAIESLRSSEIRNGLYAIGSLFQSCSDNLSTDSLNRTVLLLVNKSSSGPKFICSQALDILTRVTTCVSIERAICGLYTHVSHKNADASNNVISILADSIVPKLATNTVVGSEVIHLLIMAFSKGLSSKRASSLASSKKALASLKLIFGEDKFKEYMATVDLEEAKKSEITRIISFSSFPTSSSVQRGQGWKPFVDSQKPATSSNEANPASSNTGTKSKIFQSNLSMQNKSPRIFVAESTNEAKPEVDFLAFDL